MCCEDVTHRCVLCYNNNDGVCLAYYYCPFLGFYHPSFFNLLSEMRERTKYSNQKETLDIISDDLRWVHHIEYISKKASKCLYSLRILKRVGVAGDSILRVYLTTIQPILEYSVQVWQDIPEFLSRKLESIQKKALCIINPSLSNDNIWCIL